MNIVSNDIALLAEYVKQPYLSEPEKNGIRDVYLNELVLINDVMLHIPKDVSQK